jgi:hypothetical protein
MFQWLAQLIKSSKCYNVNKNWTVVFNGLNWLIFKLFNSAVSTAEVIWYEDDLKGWLSKNLKGGSCGLTHLKRLRKMMRNLRQDSHWPEIQTRHLQDINLDHYLYMNLLFFWSYAFIVIFLCWPFLCRDQCLTLGPLSLFHFQHTLSWSRLV